MYRPNDIAEDLIHLVGWKQDYYSETKLDPELTQSESGQYFQDIHPLLTIDNIRSISPDFDKKKPRAWIADETYPVGAKCSEGDVNYESKVENKGAKPSESPDSWEVYDEFSDWLLGKTRASILKAVESIYSKKLADKTLKNLLESKTIFDGTGRLADKIANTGSLVGFEIVPLRSGGVTTRINRVGLQLKRKVDFNSDFNSDFSTLEANSSCVLDLYLYHSSNTQPIKKVQIQGNFNGSFEWFEVDLVLPYRGSQDSGGSWYLCYRQDDRFEAINKNKDWSQTPCRCNPSEFDSYKLWSRYIEFHPFKTPIPSSEGLWDIEENIYTYDANYGMNFEITIECDLTDFITVHRQSFQNIIALQVASDMLREMAYNPSFRLNRTQQNVSRLELLYELDGDSSSEKRSGINYRLYKAMEAIDIDLRGIDRVCLPCGNKGIKYRTT